MGEKRFELRIGHPPQGRDHQKKTNYGRETGREGKRNEIMKRKAGTSKSHEVDLRPRSSVGQGWKLRVGGGECPNLGKEKGRRHERSINKDTSHEGKRNRRPMPEMKGRSWGNAPIKKVGIGRGTKTLGVGTHSDFLNPTKMVSRKEISGDPFSGKESTNLLGHSDTSVQKKHIQYEKAGGQRDEKTKARTYRRGSRGGGETKNNNLLVFRRRKKKKIRVGNLGREEATTSVPNERRGAGEKAKKKNIVNWGATD